MRCGGGVNNKTMKDEIQPEKKKGKRNEMGDGFGRNHFQVEPTRHNNSRFLTNNLLMSGLCPIESTQSRQPTKNGKMTTTTKTRTRTTTTTIQPTSSLRSGQWRNKTGKVENSRRLSLYRPLPRHNNNNNNKRKRMP